MKKITIAYVGNVANIDFREVKALQSSNKISAHLYLVHNSNDLTRLPESDEPAFKNCYPNWIFLYKKIAIKFLPLFLFCLGFSYMIRIHNREVIEKLNHYDLVVLSGEAILLAPFLNTKTIFRVTGSDLTVYPLFKLHELNTLFQLPRANGVVSKLREHIWWYLHQRLWRVAISKTTFTDGGLGKPFEDALARLNYPMNRRVNFFRLSIDPDRFNRMNDLSSTLSKWCLNGWRFLVFQPSRQMIRRDPFLVRTGQWKASDNGIQGFKLFLDRLPAEEKKSVVLMIPERNITPDLQLAKQIVIELGMERNVIYLRGENESGLSRHELIDLYSVSNAVFDDFGAGWYGGIAVEALACMAPLVTYVPDELMQKNFPWHPFQIAQSPIEIADALYRLYSDNTYAQCVRERSREWAIKFHSNASVLRTLENGFEALVRQLSKT
jgi:hypothetical protein